MNYGVVMASHWLNFVKYNKLTLTVAEYVRITKMPSIKFTDKLKNDLIVPGELAFPIADNLALVHNALDGFIRFLVYTQDINCVFTMKSPLKPLENNFIERYMNQLIDFLNLKNIDFCFSLKQFLPDNNEVIEFFFFSNKIGNMGETFLDLDGKLLNRILATSSLLLGKFNTRERLMSGGLHSSRVVLQDSGAINFITFYIKKADSEGSFSLYKYFVYF